MKRIVTVLVVWTAFCLTGVLGRYITISAATKDEQHKSTYSITEQEVQKLSKKNTSKSNNKKASESVEKKAKSSSKKSDSDNKIKVLSVIQNVTLGTMDSENNIEIISDLTDTAGMMEMIERDNINEADDNIKTDDSIAGGADAAESSNAGTKNTKTKRSTKKTTSRKNSYTELELRYMTCIIYCEARGESYAGQKAVGIVVMNRKRSDEFPGGIKKVIYQKGQFTPVTNGSLNKALALYDKYNEDGKFKGEMPSCLKAAKEVLEGDTTVKVDGKEKDMKDYLYFSRYIRNAKYTLGNHQFK